MHINPTVSGLIRGVGLAAALAAVHFLESNITGAEPIAIKPYDPIIVAGLRWVEGMIDHATKGTGDGTL